MHYEVVAQNVEEKLRAEADHCYQWSNGPGADYEVHSHPYRKILYVERGSITFTPAGRPPVAMRAGDRIDLPAGTSHGALVGAEGVVCWEGQARRARRPTRAARRARRPTRAARGASPHASGA